jgi:flagella basal body P-ring formation protein FlgA
MGIGAGVAAIGLALGAAGVAAARDAVELRTTARVAEGREVRLRDVASLSGAAAEALADTVVVPAGERAGAVDIAQVRRAIAGLEPPARVNWGRLTLRGSTCLLLPDVGPGPPTPATRPEPDAGAATVRRAILDRLAQVLSVEPQDLRVTFDDADGEVLDLSVAGRTVSVRPVGSGERVPLAVTVYEGERIIAARTLRAGVLVRRQVVVAAAARRRGDLIGPGDVASEVRWVSPGVQAAAVERAVGLAVRSRLVPGQVVTPQDLEPPVVVAKGELVAVHCVAGTVVVRTTGRALGVARDGEVVKLESLAEPGRTFYARMDGRGRAVVVQGGDTEPRP